MENAGLAALRGAKMARARTRGFAMTRRPTDAPRRDGPKDWGVRRLGYGDVIALDALAEGSEHGRFELIDGTLVELPMTSFEHGQIASLLVAVLVPAYQLGRGGPGGWWTQGENDFCSNGREVIRPDALGWRRDRLAGIDRARRVEVVPDWVCEVLSPSTRAHDLGAKLRAYARIGVGSGWYVDPSRRELTVYELRDGDWRIQRVCDGGDALNLAPFDAVSIDLAELWSSGPDASREARQPGQER